MILCTRNQEKWESEETKANPSGWKRTIFVILLAIKKLHWIGEKKYTKDLYKTSQDWHTLIEKSSGASEGYKEFKILRKEFQNTSDKK